MDWKELWDDHKGNGWAVDVISSIDGSSTNEEFQIGEVSVNEMEDSLSRQTGREWKLVERSWSDRECAVYYCEQDDTYIGVGDCYGPWACGPWKSDDFDPCPDDDFDPCPDDDFDPYPDDE